MKVQAMAFRLLRRRGARRLAQLVGLLPFLFLLGLAIAADLDASAPGRLLALVLGLVTLRWP